jgi:hypothetical protein
MRQKYTTHSQRRLEVTVMLWLGILPLSWGIFGLLAIAWLTDPRVIRAWLERRTPSGGGRRLARAAA